MSNRFHIHPFFVVAVMQMLRHGETREATRWVAAELRAVIRERTGDGDDTADTDGSGPILLPSEKRRMELGYINTPFIPHPTHEMENHDGHDDLRPR